MEVATKSNGIKGRDDKENAELSCACGETKNFFAMQGIHFCCTCGKQLVPVGCGKKKNQEKFFGMLLKAKKTVATTALSPPHDRQRMSGTPSKGLIYPTPPFGEGGDHRPHHAHADRPRRDTSTRERRSLTRSKNATDHLPLKNLLQTNLKGLGVDTEANSNGEKMRELEAAIVREFRQDQEVLEMELEQTRIHAEKLRKENGELKATLEEVMAAFQKTVDETQHKRSDHVATIGILEQELGTIREQYARTISHFKELQETHQKMSDQFGSASTNEQRLQEQNKTSDEELRKVQLQFQTLKEHAENKLKDAAVQYITVQQSTSQKDTLLVQKQHEVSNLAQRCKGLEARYAECNGRANELQAIADDYEQRLQTKITETATLTSALNTSNGQLGATRHQLAELTDVNQRYKNQVVKARETVRQQATELVRQAQVHADHALLKEKTDRIEEENTRLKSQLFDSATQARSLEERLVARQGGAAGAPEGQVAELKAAVAAKDKQNAELIKICDELLAEVEKHKKAALAHAK